MTDWREAFTELVTARGSALTRYAYLLCGEPTEAADLVQGGLLRAFSRARIGAYDLDKLESYVRRAILNLYLDDRRRHTRWRAKQHLLVEASEHDRLEKDATDAEFVRTALASLSPKQRACVVLRFYEDLPIDAIAAELACSEGTVKRHLSDARSRLSGALEITEEGLFQ